MPRLGVGSDDEDEYLGEPDRPRGGGGQTTVLALHCGTRGVSIAAVRCNLGVHFKVERKYAVAGFEQLRDAEYKPVVGSRSNAAILRRMLRRSQLLSAVLTDAARPYVVVLRPELGRRPTDYQRAKYESKGRDANCIANAIISDFTHATVFDMVRRSTHTAVKYFKQVDKKAADSHRKARAAAAGDDDDSEVDDGDEDYGDDDDGAATHGEGQTEARRRGEGQAQGMAELSLGLDIRHGKVCLLPAGRGRMRVVSTAQVLELGAASAQQRRADAAAAITALDAAAERAVQQQLALLAARQETVQQEDRMQL